MLLALAVFLGLAVGLPTAYAVHYVFRDLKPAPVARVAQLTADIATKEQQAELLAECAASLRKQACSFESCIHPHDARHNCHARQHHFYLESNVLIQRGNKLIAELLELRLQLAAATQEERLQKQLDVPQEGP